MRNKRFVAGPTLEQIARDKGDCRRAAERSRQVQEELIGVNLWQSGTAKTFFYVS
jgi:hypothetical protein